MSPALPGRLVVEVKLFLFVWPNHAGSKKITLAAKNFEAHCWQCKTIPCISNLSFFISSQHWWPSSKAIVQTPKSQYDLTTKSHNMICVYGQLQVKLGVVFQ